MAGSIDNVAMQADGTKGIVDWKRSRNQAEKCSCFGRTMRCPLEDTPDCVLWHYRVQLSFLPLFLAVLPETASGMCILGTNPDNAREPLVDAVPVMDAATAALMESCG